MASAEPPPPYRSYAAIAGTFAGGLTAAGVLGRLLDRDPECQTALDLVVLSAATFKAARTLARDEVTSFLREPFVRGHAHEGGEDPVETGDLQQAIGELVTCSRCVGTWAAAGRSSPNPSRRTWHCRPMWLRKPSTVPKRRPRNTPSAAAD